MKVKELKARKIKDTRNENAIEIYLKTNFGEFKASAPNGKSKGKFEVNSWKKDLKGDINAVNNFFIKDINIKKFSDLKLLENSFKNAVGGNTMIALEYAFLKALAFQKNKQVWEIINPKANKLPIPIGNVIGGGAHSKGKSPDFQEFHVIPMRELFSKNVEIMKRAHENCGKILKNAQKDFKNELNDENAWQTDLDNDKAIEVIKQACDNTKDEFKTTVHLGIDVAASSFYNNGNYSYKNPKSIKIKKEQIKYMNELAKDIFYLEDPLEETDFIGFSKLQSRGLIVGDDLTATSLERVRIACLKKSVNAIIVKPNQIGSLIEVKKVVDYCKENKIKTIFAHRSGETGEDILADLAFGFQADFIKTGIIGKGRDEKLNRMIDIERSL